LANFGGYYFAVVATNSSFASDASNWVYVNYYNGSLLQPPVLSAPQNVTTNLIPLTWNSIPNATTYLIYRSTSFITNLTGLTPVGTPTSPTYTDNIAAFGLGTYYYAVVASNASSNSSMSNCQGVVTLIGQTVVTVISTSNAQVQLQWVALFGADAYYIFRGTSPTFYATGMAATNASLSTTFTDFVPAYGTYYYVVVGMNGTLMVNGTSSAVVSATCSAPQSGNSGGNSNGGNNNKNSNNNNNNNSTSTQMPAWVLPVVIGAVAGGGAAVAAVVVLQKRKGTAGKGARIKQSTLLSKKAKPKKEPAKGTGEGAVTREEPKKSAEETAKEEAETAAKPTAVVTKREKISAEEIKRARDELQRKAKKYKPKKKAPSKGKSSKKGKGFWSNIPT
jgi:hypothetical protein